jgi:hypothetical protein
MRFAKIHQRGDNTKSPDDVDICSYRQLCTKKIAKDSTSAVTVSEITVSLSGMREHVFLNVMLLWKEYVVKHNYVN